MTAVIVVAGTFGGGWYAALAFVSPQQRAATATPPKPGIITASVTTGSLTQTISAQATVEQETQSKVPFPAFSGVAVVTSVPINKSGIVRSGQDIIDINGSPLIAISGKFPFYRDLNPGMKGPDVKQLQAALMTASDLKQLHAALGPTGLHLTASGTFDTATHIAISTLFKSVGHPTAAQGVSASEMVVIAGTSAKIVDLPVAVDLITPDTTMTLATGNVVAEAQVDPSLSASLKVGTPCQVTSSDGTEVAAAVSSFTLPAKVGDNATVVITPTTRSFPTDWNGSSVVAVIELHKVASASLIVPSSAIVNRGESEAVVLRELPSGRFQTVAVTEVAELNGMSAVRPVQARQLTSGDHVKVG